MPEESEHIKFDRERVTPLWRNVVDLLVERHGLDKDRIHEAMDEWRLQKSDEQFSTLLSIAAQSDAIANSSDGMVQITSATTERLKSMSTEGIIFGPATRMLVGLSEHHDELSLSSVDVRKALNEAAHELGSSIKELVPTLMPFMEGRDSVLQSATRH